MFFVSARDCKEYKYFNFNSYYEQKIEIALSSLEKRKIVLTMFGYEIHFFGHGYALSHETFIEELIQSRTLTTIPFV